MYLLGAYVLSEQFNAIGRHHMMDFVCYGSQRIFFIFHIEYKFSIAWEGVCSKDVQQMNTYCCICSAIKYVHSSGLQIITADDTTSSKLRV